MLLAYETAASVSSGHTGDHCVQGKVNGGWPLPEQSQRHDFLMCLPIQLVSSCFHHKKYQSAADGLGRIGIYGLLMKASAGYKSKYQQRSETLLL